MALTTDELQAIGEAVRPIVKEEVHGLRTEMNQQFERIDKRFDQVDRRLDGIAKSIDELIQAVTVEGNERYSDHEQRIKALEQAQHTR